MLRTPVVRLALAAGVALVISACQDQPTSPDPRGLAASPQRSAQGGDLPSTDELSGR